MENWREKINSLEDDLKNMNWVDALNYLNMKIHNSDNLENIAIYLFEKGYIKIKNDKIEEGLKDLNESLNLLMEMENSEMRGYLLTKIGNIYLHTGDTYTAIEILREASKNFPENSQRYVMVLNGIGEAYKRLENFEKALLFYKDAYKKSKGKYRDTEIFSAENIAEVYSMMKDRTNAEIWLQRAINAADEVKDETLQFYLSLCKAMIDGNIKKARNIANKLKKEKIPMGYMIADAFYYYSSFLPENIKLDFIKEALLIYSDLSDGTMRDLCTEKLDK